MAWGTHGARMGRYLPSLLPAGHILRLPTLVPEDIQNPVWEDRKEKGLGHTLADTHTPGKATENLRSL